MFLKIIDSSLESQVELTDLEYSGKTGRKFVLKLKNYNKENSKYNDLKFGRDTARFFRRISTVIVFLVGFCWHTTVTLLFYLAWSAETEKTSFVRQHTKHGDR